MRNVVIVVVLVVLGVVGGFFLGGFATQPTPMPVESAGASMDERLLASQRAFSAGADTMARRQANGQLGAAVGGGIGLVAGLGAAVSLRRKGAKRV